jgi:hypothetical protein
LGCQVEWEMSFGFPKCPHCGAELPADLPYCPSCGFKVASKPSKSLGWMRITLFVVAGLPLGIMGGCSLVAVLTEKPGPYTGLGWIIAAFGLFVFAALLIDLIRHRKRK